MNIGAVFPHQIDQIIGLAGHVQVNGISSADTKAAEGIIGVPAVNRAGVDIGGSTADTECRRCSAVGDNAVSASKSRRGDGPGQNLEYT